jgi:hypothetical protein
MQVSLAIVDVGRMEHDHFSPSVIGAYALLLKLARIGWEVAIDLLLPVQIKIPAQ